ncbi:hypothetical protein BJX66DRAFT_174064 [Aspergillus keveii]|uniref:Uncharacterized protein n=1 Tax=Aspergillus keveii TaxID=714993 RepID=A0ABR4FH84_9EURO
MGISDLRSANDAFLYSSSPPSLRLPLILAPGTLTPAPPYTTPQHFVTGESPHLLLHPFGGSKDNVLRARDPSKFPISTNICFIGSYLVDPKFVKVPALLILFHNSSHSILTVRQIKVLVIVTRVRRESGGCASGVIRVFWLQLAASFAARSAASLPATPSCAGIH